MFFLQEYRRENDSAYPFFFSLGHLSLKLLKFNLINFMIIGARYPFFLFNFYPLYQWAKSPPFCIGFVHSQLQKNLLWVVIRGKLWLRPRLCCSRVEWWAGGQWGADLRVAAVKSIYMISKWCGVHMSVVLQ